MITNPNKHPRFASRKVLGNNSGMFQGFPGDFQQQALLRVHAHGFPRGNPKEMGVEFIHILYKAAPAGYHFSGRARIGVVKPVHVPAIRGNFRNGINPVMKQFPERFQIRCPRHAGTHPDNGNGFIQIRRCWLFRFCYRFFTMMDFQTG